MDTVEMAMGAMVEIARLCELHAASNLHEIRIETSNLPNVVSLHIEHRGIWLVHDSGKSQEMVN